MTYTIQRVAVIGAGTMGGGIAAHFANAGYQVDLLDIPAEGATVQERNKIVLGLWDRVKKARPSALFTADVADRVRIGNTQDNFDRLAQADWIIEVIIEKLEPKRELMERVDAVRKPNAIVTSNTSGIPIHQIGEGRSQSFRQHFLGTHFFNPPRYLKLLEVIPTPDTSPEVIAFVKEFATRVLGKGVVVCKDTPNFIANRLGSFDGLYSLRAAIDNGFTVEEIDYLAGPLIGNPKTALFRLQDLVGLDIAMYVAKNLYDAAPNDESREVYRIPATIQTMLDRKMLGNKTGGGFYKEVRQGGNREFWVLDLNTLEYKAPTKVSFPEVEKVKRTEPLGARMKALVNLPDSRAGRFLWETTANSLAYASRRVPEISDDLPSVDRAMRWGFSRAMGPFELWDALGVRETVERMSADGIEVAPWVHKMLAAGHTSFYKNMGSKLLAYSPVSGIYCPIEEDPLRVNLNELRHGGCEIKRNESASLIDLGDGVLGLEFHSRGNSIDDMMGQLLQEALDKLESSDKYVGLVIGNQGENFCLGANIGFVAMNAMAQQFGAIEAMVKNFQDLLMRVRFSPKPVVVAPHGMTLGGGAEIVMAGACATPAAETYMGLVEVGVGLIPGGGGCKEMVRRVLSPAMKTPNVDPLPFLERIFLQLGQAKVSTSALEARSMGMLDEADLIVMHPDHTLGEAKELVLDLISNYQPPVREKSVYAAGKPMLAALKMGIWQFQEARQISEHDAKIARKLAYVLCGGELSSGQWVDEQYILDLEREAFMSLVGEPKTLERIGHTLQTGKPLRN